MAKTAASPEEDKSILKNAILWRIYVIMLLMFIGGLIIVLRIGTVQAFQGKALRAKADSLYVQMRPIEAPRGNILAADGSLLATSLPYYEVRWDMLVGVNRNNPRDTPYIPEQLFYRYVDTLAICLATYIDGELTPGAYRDKLVRAYQAGDRNFLIRKNISYLELERIRKFPIFNKGTKKNLQMGLIVTRMSKRQYPFKILANRTIGYIRYKDVVDSSGRGVRSLETDDTLVDTVKVGLEESYDKILAGEDVRCLMRHEGNNIWVPLDDISKIEPKAGKDILTTIDINLQDVAENALIDAVRTYQADNGSVILMEVATGDIKAIANIGANADRTDFWENYNYAIGVKGEPGSAFKIATMMALYEDGLIHLDDTVNLNQGKWKFYDAELEDAMAHGLNLTTLEKAFEVSSNVGIAKLAQKHYNQTPEGRQRFLDKIRQFRLDKPTGIKITGEPEPYIKVPNSPEWSGITIPWMSIGYETELTPMQMLTFYGAIANNGKMMKPRLVKETQSYGVTEEVFPPEVLSREIANEETIKFAKYLLLRPVEGTQGTAKNIRTDQYRIAGKTGTAIMNFEAHLKRGEAKRYRASFAGFFPAEKPIYACVVFITNPRIGFYGGTVAAPVFRKIADKAYSRAVLSHPSINTAPVVYNAKNLPDLQVGFKQDFKRVFDYLQIPFTEEANTAWTIGRVQGDSLFLLMRNMQPDIVPNVVGMGLRDAIFLLENRKIKVKTVGVGKVKSQSIKPGRSIQSVGNEGITLVLGS